MPNLYATPAEIKAALPYGMRSTTTILDPELWRLAEMTSRLVDNLTHRVFYPVLETRYFHMTGSARPARIGHLISVTSVSISADDGATYTALAASDYFLSVEGDPNARSSWTHVHLDANGDYSAWYAGQRALKIVGVWGYTDDRDAAWEDSGDEVEDNPLTDSATALAVNDAAGADLWGQTPRLQAGQLIRMGEEYAELTQLNSATAGVIVRGRNGTAAAEHAQNTQIDIWRPPAPVKQAVITQLVRNLMRAIQGFGDARAVPEVSTLVWVRSLDPDVVTNLGAYTDPLAV